MLFKTGLNELLERTEKKKSMWNNTSVTETISSKWISLQQNSENPNHSWKNIKKKKEKEYYDSKIKKMCWTAGTYLSFNKEQELSFKKKQSTKHTYCCKLNL